MRLLRLVLSITVPLLLMAGYLESQYYQLVLNQPAIYAAKVDQQPIRTLALVIFALAVVLSFLPEGDPSQK